MSASQAPIRRRFPAHPSSVGQARALTRQTLSEPAHEPLVDDAQLLVSEVVTNALMHAGTPIDFALSLFDGTVRVEVSDGAAHLPVRRDYGTMAGTGRGLQLLETLADQWGVDLTGDGKTVWFELSPPGAEARDDGPQTAPARVAKAEDADDAVTVTLRNVPLLLHAAWHQHAESVLREYLLFRLDDLDAVDEIEMHAAAHEAMALLIESIPAPELGDQPEELLAAAIEPLVSKDRVLLHVPRALVPSFAMLNETLDAALELALAGKFLTPPMQPEMRALRQWLCREVVQQSAGAPGTPWAGLLDVPPQTPPVDRDTEEIAASELALVAADDRNRIVAASQVALEMLGYSRADQLVGRRILAIIPARYHQAHLAGFTLHLNVGRSPLLERSVTVPALRGDGTEALVELTVTTRQSSGGGRLFVAELKEPGTPAGEGE
ncbi:MULTISPECIES: ATP-binding protein [Nocardioides]|uniref:ATP-binding protein n=1 Tax=Nocardioides vastitatis TaxID=2568655 RepID=A0ABW0ZGB6_9ACTN|nr:PAS domain S-box protein [Nocardioides sp.]THI97915.1 PAS domain S-box protein [Nocardioides sp.]